MANYEHFSLKPSYICGSVPGAHLVYRLMQYVASLNFSNSILRSWVMNVKSELDHEHKARLEKSEKKKGMVKKTVNKNTGKVSTSDPQCN